MKKHTRLLAILMTLAMISNCFAGFSAFAEDVDTSMDRSSDVCDTTDHSDWTELNQTNIAENMFLYDQHYYLYEGSYYLTTDLAMGVTIYIWPGDTVDLCLNGHDISMTNTTRTILNPKNSATLNLYDCGEQVRYYDEDGWVTAPTDGWDSATEAEIEVALAEAKNPIKVIGGAIYGATSYDKGGAGVFIQNYATFNMYGGNILGCSCSTSGHYGGGVYNYEGTFNMYSGVIAYNASSSYAGGVFVRTGSTMNMYGGEIAYNYAPISGAGVYSGGVVTMSGDASIHDNYGSNLASGFYNAGGGTLNMEDSSSIYDNVSGDGGSAGVYMPSYSSILNMSGTSSITGNKSTGITAGVGLISGVMTISNDAKVFDNYVVDSVTVADDLKSVTTGENVLDSNVYLSNGKTITFENFDGNDVFVTSANGLGLVATGVDDTEDSGNLSSDVESYYAVRVDETTVHLVEAQTLDGEEDDIDYADGTIDLSALDIFEAFEVDSEYTIKGGTGVGEIVDGELAVSSVGTFIIEAVTPHCNTNPPTTQVSTLTVNPIEVNVKGIGTIGNVVGTIVELDNTSGDVTGSVNEDDVSIDFSAAYGVISDENYVDGQTYAVSIHGISITGEDADNYTLGTVNNGEGTSVTIDVTLPHISWPTAEDIVYGDDRSDDDLIGGIVVIQTGNESDGYEYIPVKGSFEWVYDDANSSAGTHTYEVQFVVSDTTYDEDTIAAIEALTHNVTQVVQAAEVSFAITDSIISDSSKLEITATTDSDNYVLQYADAATMTVTDEVPTDAGTYYVYAYFTTDNYRHAGTQESTGKQIGSFVIGDYDDKLTNLTFTGYTGNSDVKNLTDVLPQTIHILPTLEGDDYTAWSTEVAGVTTVYAFGSRFAQPDYDVTFTAVEAAESGEISGTITGTDFDDETTTLEGVVVTLMQGAEQIDTFTTTSAGAYEFNVPQGRYNLVVTRDQVIRNEETVYVYLESKSEEVNVTIPDIRQNTVFNVASGMTAITVEGMEDLMDDGETRSVKVELNPSSDTANILALAATKNLTADNAKYYIDLSIQQRGETDASYAEKDLEGTEELTFYIPLAGIYQGYGNYEVYFDDGVNDVEILTSGVNVSDTGDLLTLTAQKSGVYGLVFWDDATDVTPETVPTETVTYSATDAISTDELFDHIESDGTRSYLITSTDGGEATIDSAGNVTVTKVGTFTVTVKVAKTASDDACYSTATLTVNPKPVTISGITCVDQEVSDITDCVVDLNTGALLTGVEDGDSVRIDFTKAVGTIAEDYAENVTLTTTGTNTFDVTVTGLTLDGTDAGNYTISTDPTSKVTINMSLVYIAWPTAIDTVYGDTDGKGRLYGGKVVVYYGETYTDITVDGYFQWVSNSSNGTLGGAGVLTPQTDAGTYTYDVEFVEYEGSGASYSTALASTTQMVTQVVQPAAVTFTIAESVLGLNETLSISVTDEFGNELATEDYSYLYYVGGEWVEDAPTVTGSYLIGASVTSNYRHAGTQEYTAKQIGAFTIDIADPDVYDVTFTGFKGDDVDNITDALPQSIHILPSLDEDEYTGWKDTDGIIYDFGERFPQPENDVIFTAIEAPDKVTITGEVTGTDINGDTSISRVGVALYQGSTLVDYTTTGTGDELGTYSFDVLPGMYNLVVTYNLDSAIEMTAFVNATDATTTEDFAFSEYIQNTQYNVSAGLPDMVVDGLKDLLASGTDSEILLEVTASEDTTIEDKIKAEAYENGIDSDELKEFFNIDLYSRTGDEAASTAVTKADELLTFYIPLTGIYQGHDEYTVYRYHDGEVQALTEQVNDEGEYIKVSDTNLIIHAKYFSLYGIAFDNETKTNSGSSTTVTTTTTTTTEVEETTESELPFTDVSVDDWFYEDVLYLYELGIMSGTSDTTFDPYGGNSRAMVAQLMYNLEGQPERTEFDFFPDVTVGQWFEEAINWCATNGVVDGYTDGLYRPDQIISRQEFANVLYDHCLHLGYDVSELNDLSAFKDAPSEWAETYMMWAVGVEILQGDTEGYLNSTDQLTRCEAAAMFARFLRTVY